jgi:very-short-patch-repair endonuclease/predicted transcriptional regulator of viral defense system
VSPPRREREIATIAARQHGVISTHQLLSLGLTRSAVNQRAAAGRLHRVHPGVFAVGHPIVSREGAYMAAVLACGPGALLSHRSAAALWDLRRSERPRVDVTAPGRRRRAIRRIEAHRSRTLGPRDATCVKNIPCTSVARTLVDLAEVVDGRALERACEQAEILNLFNADALEDALVRARGRHGAPRLRAVLGAAVPAETPTRSELEERFLAVCRAARLPRPEVNAWIPLASGEGVEADFLWREQALIVETDGHATHGTRRAFERDRRRDQRLALAGYRVIRFTWRQVASGPGEVAQTVGQLLAGG